MLVLEIEAGKKACPVSQAMPLEHQYRCCLGSGCMAWRWQPLLADDAFLAAVVKAAEEIGDKSANKHKAAAHVSRNRAKYGLPTEPTIGFCGMTSERANMARGPSEE